MSRCIAIILMLVAFSVRAMAGPNTGGVIVVHNTGIEWTTDMPTPPASPVPAFGDSCSGFGTFVNEVPMGSAPGEYSASVVWKVYAAFPPASSPRLKAVGWGIHLSNLNGGGVAYMPYSDASGPPTPAVFYMTSYDWPASGADVGMSFTDSVRVNTVTELWWFGGYGYAGSAGEPQAFSVIPHTVPQNQFFVDDAIPGNRDLVADYGSLGFGEAGYTPCPVPQGSCCYWVTHCEVMSESRCEARSGIWTPGGSCEPNPCGPTSSVAEVDQGRALEVRAIPNPTTSKVRLQIAGPQAPKASLLLFDAAGRKLRTVWAGALPGASFSVEWDGRDDVGHRVPAGVYLVRLESPAGEAVCRLVKTW